MLPGKFAGFLLLFALIPSGFGQNEPVPDLNATNGTLAVDGPSAVDQTAASTSPPPPAPGPLERLGQLAKSLSPFPLNNSAPAPPTDPQTAMNGTNTSPGANGPTEMATNATGAFTPYNATISPLEMPPTASTNLPPAVPVAGSIQGDAATAAPLNTTTSTTTSRPPPPPPQPASAPASFGKFWPMALGPVLVLLFGWAMI